MKQKNIKDFVDNTVITATGLMLAGSIVLIGQAQLKSEFLRYFLAISLTSLSFSFLLTIWHKWRFPIREQFFQEQSQELENRMVEEVTELVNSTITPVFVDHGARKIQQEGVKGERQLKKRIEEYATQAVNEQRPLFLKLLEGYAPEFEILHKKAYQSPLDEKFARLKYLLDYLAFKSRYTFFVIGFILFLASLLSQLFQGNAT